MCLLWHTSCFTSRLGCLCLYRSWHCLCACTINMTLFSTLFRCNVCPCVNFCNSRLLRITYFLHIRYAYFALFLSATCIKDSISYSNVCVYDIKTTHYSLRSELILLLTLCCNAVFILFGSLLEYFSRSKTMKGLIYSMSLLQGKWAIILSVSKPIN